MHIRLAAVLAIKPNLPSNRPEMVIKKYAARIISPMARNMVKVSGLTAISKTAITAADVTALWWVSK